MLIKVSIDSTVDRRRERVRAYNFLCLSCIMGSSCCLLWSQPLEREPAILPVRQGCVQCSGQAMAQYAKAVPRNEVRLLRRDLVCSLGAPVNTRDSVWYCHNEEGWEDLLQDQGEVW